MNARSHKRHTERDPDAPDDNVKGRKRVSAQIEKIVRDRLADTIQTRFALEVINEKSRREA